MAAQTPMGALGRMLGRSNEGVQGQSTTAFTITDAWRELPNLELDTIYSIQNRNESSALISVSASAPTDLRAAWWLSPWMDFEVKPSGADNAVWVRSAGRAGILVIQKAARQ